MIKYVLEPYFLSRLKQLYKFSLTADMLGKILVCK